MAVITLPDDLYISSMTWAQHRNDVESRSIFGAQSQEGTTPLWAVTLDVDQIWEAESGSWKALLLMLKGRANQLALWDVARPVPLGTMRGTMTLNSDAAVGATTLSIVASGEASKTLVQGDWLGLGSGTTQQVVMVMEGATADATGLISVSVEPPLRDAFTAGSSVTWDKPKALFRRQSSRAGWDYQSVFASGFSLDLLEDWRA